MGDECRDCIQSELVHQLIDRVGRLEEKTDQKLQEQGQRIGDLERKTDVNEEQTKMIFKILGEIKDSIDKIGTKLEVLEKEPGEKWKKAIEVIIGFAIASALGYFIGGK